MNQIMKNILAAVAAVIAIGAFAQTAATATAAVAQDLTSTAAPVAVEPEILEDNIPLCDGRRRHPSRHRL